MMPQVAFHTTHDALIHYVALKGLKIFQHSARRVTHWHHVDPSGVYGLLVVYRHETGMQHWRVTHQSYIHAP